MRRQTPGTRLTNELMLAIPHHFPHIMVWRNNRIEGDAPATGGGTRHVSAGINGQGDIEGIIKPTGRMLQLEVKAGKDRMRPTQIAFKFMIEDYGGLYMVARNVPDCLIDLGEAL